MLAGDELRGPIESGWREKRGRERGIDQISKSLANCFEKNIGQRSYLCVCFQGSVQVALKEVEDLREEHNHKNLDNLNQYA